MVAYDYGMRALVVLAWSAACGGGHDTPAPPEIAAQPIVRDAAPAIAVDAVASEAPGERGTRGNGDHPLDYRRGPAVTGPGDPSDVGPAKGIDDVPIGKLTFTGVQAMDESTLTADVVAAKLRAVYVSGLRRCYTQQLKRTPELRGKLVLQFEVRATGRVANVRATGVSDEVDSCASGQMQMWRFPIPRDKDGDTEDVSFVVTVALEPR
jgi:hypothetical protein